MQCCLPQDIYLPKIFQTYMTLKVMLSAMGPIPEKFSQKSIQDDNKISKRNTSLQFSKAKLILLKLITLSSFLLRYVSVFQSCVIFYSSSVHVGRKPLIQVDTGQVLCWLYIAFLLQISQTISVLWPLLLIDMNF